MVLYGTPEGFSGAIYRFLANISGQEVNPKNIIVHQMEDGTELESTVIYKLYKIIDGEEKLVKLNENRIGDYDIGSQTSDIKTATGRLYLNNIGEGTYKLVGNAKELEFTISSNGISDNIVENRFRSKSNVISSAIATLILQLQTGLIRTPYIIIISLIILAIIITFILQNKKDSSKEEIIEQKNTWI